MKQFNLKEYLIDPSQKVVTRDGRPVRIVCTDRIAVHEDKTSRIVGLILMKEGYESIMAFNENGSWDDSNKSNYDLFFAPQKQSRWVFLYRTLVYGEIYSSNVFSTKEAAEREMKALNGFALTEITWKE